MHNTPECLNEGGESSSSACVSVMTTLTDVLQPSAPDRYSLSARAASGIIRRSAKRGRKLPGELHTALTQLAHSQQESTASPMECKSSCKDTSSQAWTVRRLTPTECERLMGYPDGHTVVPRWKRRAASSPASPEDSAQEDRTPLTPRPDGSSPWDMDDDPMTMEME